MSDINKQLDEIIKNNKVPLPTRNRYAVWCEHRTLSFPVIAIEYFQNNFQKALYC